MGKLLMLYVLLFFIIIGIALISWLYHKATGKQLNIKEFF